MPMARASTTIPVHLSSILRDYCGGASQMPVTAGSVREALAQIERENPGLHRAICDETGAVRRHINVFVNSDAIRDLDGLDTPIGPGDVLTILPAVSGG